MGPFEVTLIITEMTTRKGAARTNANRLPAISIDLLIRRAARFGSPACSISGYNVESVGPPPPSSSECSGNTWKESLISLICSILNIVQSALVTLVSNALATDFPSAAPTSVKITPITESSLYHPMMSVSLMECESVAITLPNGSRFLSVLSRPQASRSIRQSVYWIAPFSFVRDGASSQTGPAGETQDVRAQLGGC